jgi:hypothetical protein
MTYQIGMKCGETHHGWSAKDMKLRRYAYVSAVRLLILILSGTIAGESQASDCQSVDLPLRSLGGGREGFLIEPEFWVSAEFVPASATDASSGQRLVMRRRSPKGLDIVFISTVTEDSSAFNLTFYPECGPHHLLIFAEIGNEYSWGLRIFAMDAGQIRDLGLLPFAAQGMENPESAITSIRLKGFDDHIEITPTVDLLRDPGGRSEKVVPKGQVRFRIGPDSLLTSDGPLP